MKRWIIVLLFLALAGSVTWSERRQLRRTLAERERLSFEWKRLDRRATEMEAEMGRLESEVATGEQLLGSQRRVAATKAETLRRAALTNTFGPQNGTLAWSEEEPFVWLEKKHLSSLGVVAFRAADSGETDAAFDTTLLLNRLKQQFFAEHPEFAPWSSLTPELAAKAKDEYVKMLADAADSLDEKTRPVFAAAIRQAENSPLPGAMTQAPATYGLNETAVTLLGMSAAERGETERATAEMVERYHELERRYVSESDEHASEVSGPEQPRASFAVATFPDEGGAVKAEWIAGLNAALGAERTEYLLQMAASWIRSDLGDFGEAERTITFREGPRSGGYSDKTTKGYRYSQGTGGPVPIPAGWRHLLARPAEGGLPQLRPHQ